MHTLNTVVSLQWEMLFRHNRTKQLRSVMVPDMKNAQLLCTTKAS